MTRKLAPRQEQIAVLWASGVTKPKVARELGISPRTVETVLDVVRIKLDVRSREELRACLSVQVRAWGPE